MSRKKRSVGRASKLLAEYEQLNSDLPKETRRQLAIFVFAPKVGTDVLEELYDQSFGSTPMRHRSWLWYNAMELSGLGRFWDHFAALKNNGVSSRDCLLELKDLAHKDEWETFSNRLGVVIFKDRRSLNPYWWRSTPGTTEYWTRGGVWTRATGFTKIIILGEHVERDHNYNAFSKNLGEGGARLLERELYNTIDEEEMLFPDAVWRATTYTRERIPQLAAVYEDRRASAKTASWFFDGWVPHSPGRIIHTKSNTPMISDAYDWFPHERAQRKTKG